MSEMFPAEVHNVRDYGMIESALLRIWARSATIIDVQKPAEGYRLITMEGEALKNVRWQPGQKVQMQLGGFASRTYTPLLWDSEEGVVQILVYLHYLMLATTPGTAWATSIQAGDTCRMIGPRDSLNLSAVQRPAIFFGDETSIGLARAFKATKEGFSGICFVLEVASVAKARQVLDALNLPDMTLVERKRDDSHLAQAGNDMHLLVEAHAPRQFIFSGKAGSIQRMTRTLRENGALPLPFNAKAHWTPGKKGLD